MASDLKLDQVMTASQRGPNVHLMGNPAVVSTNDIILEKLGGSAALWAAHFLFLFYFYFPPPRKLIRLHGKIAPIR